MDTGRGVRTVRSFEPRVRKEKLLRQVFDSHRQISLQSRRAQLIIRCEGCTLGTPARCPARSRFRRRRPTLRAQSAKACPPLVSAVGALAPCSTARRAHGTIPITTSNPALSPGRRLPRHVVVSVSFDRIVHGTDVHPERPQRCRLETPALTPRVPARADDDSMNQPRPPFAAAVLKVVNAGRTLTPYRRLNVDPLRGQGLSE